MSKLRTIATNQFENSNGSASICKCLVGVLLRMECFLSNREDTVTHEATVKNALFWGAFCRLSCVADLRKCRIVVQEMK